MTVLMFQPQFAPLVESGDKPHTIRPARKRLIRVGDRLSLRRWSGVAYRSKQVILRETRCKSLSAVYINETFQEIIFVVNGERLNQEQWVKLARDDGFACTTDMLDWFRKTHGLPFNGILITWEV